MSDESGKKSSAFTLSVTTSTDNIDKKNLKKEIVDILINNMVLKNTNFDFINSLNPSATANIENLVISEVSALADKLINSFYSSLSQTYLNHGENPENITKDLTSVLKSDITDVSSRAAKLKQLSNEWWVETLYRENVFNNLENFYINLYKSIEGDSDLNSITITYNSIPVFMIENVSDIINLSDNKNEMIASLKGWVNSENYDEKRMINISNKIVFEDKIANFSLSKNNKSMTELQRPSSTDKLKKVKLSNDFTETEINKFQHLLLTQDDKPELFVNDTGVNSSMDLYNDNINKISQTKNAENYISKINEESLINVNNVLRLYEKLPSDNLSQFKLNPLPVNYGETRMVTGLFNPSVYNRSLIFYKSELSSIIKYADLIEVPVVDIDGKTYFLAHIANGENSTVLTGNLDEMLNNATNNILSKIKSSNEFVFYVDPNTNEKKLVNKNIKVICSVNFNGNLMDELWPNNSLIHQDKMYFLQYCDLYNYVKTVLAKNGVESNTNPY